MKFSWQWLRELSGTSLDATKAAELLSAKSFETVASDDVLDIDVLPNRPDCLSHLGVARELCALENMRFAAPSYEYETAAHPGVAVTVQGADACPRFSALIVRGVKVGPSPKWLTAHLETCGLRSINNIVDVTNYVMLELGQPMHAFDLRKVEKLVIRRAKKGERVRALDEARTEYELDPSVMVVADASRALSIAGIKGGADSGITDDTTDVLLEAANWDPGVIRAASRKLGLRTDASVRFSYGVDPNLTAPSLVRAGELLAKSAGGQADGDIIDVYPKPLAPWQIPLDPEHARRLLGADIGTPQMRGILTSLGFESEDRGGKLIVTVPTRRSDARTPEDLIEEIGRIHGYDRIPSAVPVLPVYDPKAWVHGETDRAWDEYDVIRERNAIANLLVGAGYSEVFNYSFLSDELHGLLDPKGLDELAEPQSAEYRWLRRSLVPRLVVNLRDNLRFADEVRIFESGHTFGRIGEGKEPLRLGLALAKRSGDTDAFYELKGAVDLLLQRLGIDDVYYDDAEPFPWDAGAVNATATGRRAVVRIEGEQTILGFIGAVSGRIAEAMKLKGSAVVAELDLRTVIEEAEQENEFEPLPKYPSVIRDISVLVEQGVKVDDILQTAEDAGGDIVTDVDVFDIFLPTGEEKLKAEGDTPEYGKSVAFHVVFRAPDRTLTDKEVDVAEAAIKTALQEELDAQIR